MTPAQKATIKAHYQANMSTLSDDQARDAFNAQAAPDYWVTRTNITKGEILHKPSQDATTFVWVGVGYITRTMQELTAFNNLFDEDTGFCNAAFPGVKQAFADIFSGSGNAALNRTHCLAVARRKSTLAEKLLATGAGTTVAPSLMGWEGSFTTQDVIDALST